jgi:hypothetical protein
MRKLKKPLFIAAGAVVLVAAAVLGILSIVKTTPWELTNHIVPSDVTAAFLWKGAYSAQLTEDEIISVVHLLNRLDKSTFTIKYGYLGFHPAYGLIVQCGDLEIRISPSSGTRAPLVMTFDKTTSETFISGKWYLHNADLASHINALLDARAAEIP